MKKKKNKQELLARAMEEFDKHGGGTAVDPRYTAKNPESLKDDLQASFDSIFPELMKKSKHRKHVIFDDDVFEIFEGLSKSSNAPFSALINSALRSFVNEKVLNLNKDPDPLAELVALKKRARELSKQIDRSDLDIDFKDLLGS